MNPNQIRRFMSYVSQSRGCWIWTSCKNDSGYGLFWIDKKAKRSHRLSYELFVGDIPKGLTLDHLCRNRACVNPTHLEAVTYKENTLRGIGLTAKNKQKTHCPKGHEYDENNTSVYNNKRYCKECQKINLRNFNLKLKDGNA